MVSSGLSDSDALHGPGLRPAVGGSVLGGLAISWLAFAVAMVLVFYLARLDVARRRASWAVLLATTFPFAFIYGTVYSEALFLAATVRCVCSSARGAGCSAVCAARWRPATRVNGIMMWPALAWIVSAAGRWLERRHAEIDRAPPPDSSSSARHRRLLAAIFDIRPPASEWAATIERWGYHPGWFARFRSGSWAMRSSRARARFSRVNGWRHDSLNGLAAVFAILAVPFVWRSLGAACGAFTGGEPLAAAVLPVRSKRDGPLRRGALSRSSSGSRRSARDEG